MKNLATPRGTITIRQASVDDAAALRELRLEALAKHPQAFAADSATTAAEPASLWAERIAAYASGNTAVVYVAEAEGGLVGMAGLARGHWPKTQHGATFWGVYVREEWRGLHVAEALLQGCITWARGQGVEVVKLGVITTNAPAIRCYARCGFAVYGVDPQVIRCDGISYDELLMARPI